MDLIGLPEQIVIGPRGLAAGTVEIKNRRSEARQDLPIEAINRLTTPHPNPLPQAGRGGEEALAPYRRGKGGARVTGG